ncbi:MAG: branched-chain amino acid aminotransferase [Pseudomonadota bacterium]
MAGQAWTFFDGEWHEGNPKVAGPMTMGFWAAATVFDGARAVDGLAPDLDLHCQRAVRSAKAIGLRAEIDPETIEGLAREGVAKHGNGAALYIKPMFWAESGIIISPDPDSTNFLVCVSEVPMPEGHSNSIISDKRRPGAETAPTAAKASCLYPHGGLALAEALERGYENAIMCDPIGHVSEFATANLFLAKDGVVSTPAPNGTLLNGITRQRVIGLLRQDGIEVEERSVTLDEVRQADEVFSTGNYAKVQSFTRIEGRDLQPGPMFKRAHELYWDYASSQPV